MRNLKHLSLTEDDPTMTTGDDENLPSDAENGRIIFYFYIYFIYVFILDDE